MSSAKILELRSLIAEKFPAPAAPARLLWPTGIAPLDSLLGGGLPRGALSEMVATAKGTGCGLLLHELVEKCAQMGGRLALVDGADAFDPDDFENDTLRRILWVRCRDAAMATQAADWLVRDGNLPLLIVDLTLSPSAQLRRIPTSTWHRLARTAEDRGVACMALTPHPLVASAAVRFELVRRFSLDALDSTRDELVASLQWRWLRRREVFADNVVEFPRVSAA